ncbi:hypothetical protein ACPZ19_39740, partial [Amycolatopsis lurida]
MTSERPPIADYDQLPIGSVQHRIRSLEAPALRALVEYEQSHGDRRPVLEILHARLDQLAAGAGQTPNRGRP